MQVTRQNENYLLIEQNPWLARVVFLAIGAAGILLTLATIKEHGAQSWYRLTYTGGLVIAAVAPFAYGLLIRPLKLSANRLSGRLTVSRKSWLYSSTLLDLKMSEVVELRMNSTEKKILGNRRTFWGLELRTAEKGLWQELLPPFTTDDYEIKRQLRLLEAYLLDGTKEPGTGI